MNSTAPDGAPRLAEPLQVRKVFEAVKRCHVDYIIRVSRQPCFASAVATRQQDRPLLSHAFPLGVDGFKILFCVGLLVEAGERATPLRPRYRIGRYPSMFRVIPCSGMTSWS